MSIDMENGRWKTETRWVSQLNFDENVTDRMNLPEHVAFHDSTLRDGEQAPGIVFSKEHKLRIAGMLDAAGIEYIEAGFPAISEAEQDIIRSITSMDLSAKITCLCRAMEQDIDLAAECGVWGAIIELPVSYPRLKYQFGWDEDAVIEKALRICSHAKKRGLNTRLFMIDSTRAELDFLERLLKKVVPETGVDCISIVDTNGVIMPTAMAYLVGLVRQWVSVPIEVHCHNDFGMGVANSMQGIESGATSISCALNALGQRAGNAATEECAMAVECLYGIDTGIDFQKLAEVCELVKRLSGWSFPPNKPVTGEKLFTWEAGIPTAALLKNPHTVEPYQPEFLGRRHDVVVGKKSGKANIVWKCRELGLRLNETRADEILAAVKDRATAENRPVTDAELTEIIARYP